MSRFWKWVTTKGWPWIVGVLGIIGAVLLVMLTLGSGKGKRVLERQVDRRRQLKKDTDAARERTDAKVDEIEERKDADLEKVVVNEKEALEAIEKEAALQRKKAEEEASGKFQKDQPDSDLRSELDELLARSRRGK